MNANDSRTLLSLILLLVLTGCRSSPLDPIDLMTLAETRVPPPWLPTQRLEDRGEHEAALVAYERALEEFPTDIELHRAYQKLLGRGAGKARLFREYRAKLEAGPEDPAAHYLYGRLFNDPEPKRRHFRRALELDPSFAWALHGLGAMAIGDGDLDSARILLGSALASDPGIADTWIAYASLLQVQGDLPGARQAAALLSAVRIFSEEGPLLEARLALTAGDREASLDACREALGRNPLGESCHRQTRAILIRYGDESAWQSAFDTIQRASSARPNHEALTSLGHYLARLGRPFLALTRFRQALEAGGSPAAVLPEMRRLDFLTGEYRAGFDAWRRTIPDSLWNAPDNVLRAPFEELSLAITRAEESGSTEDLQALGEQLDATGWSEEASHVFARARLVEASPDLDRAIDRVGRHLAFEHELEQLFTSMYAGERPDLARSLDQVVEEIRRLSLRTLGEDVVGDPPRQSYFLIGELLDPAGSGLMQYFRERNRFFLLGQETGGVVQATLMSLVAKRKDVRLERAGEVLHFDEIVCESQSFGGAAEAAGAEYAGATFEGFYYVQIDSVRRTAWELTRPWPLAIDVSEIEPWPAETEEDRLATWEPLGVPQRLAARLGLADLPPREAWNEALELVYDGVAVHEQGHLADIAFFMPITENLWRGIGFLSSHLFSGTMIRAALEGRAQRLALSDSTSPGLALSHAASYLPYPDVAPPHSDGFSSLVNELLEALAEDEVALSQLVPSANLFQQLDRLDDETIRRLAKELR
ncbi:MAG: hypothetical protein RL885_03165 [Planctomycetota bacterium]